jgi:hypothetical protein
MSWTTTWSQSATKLLVMDLSFVTSNPDTLSNEITWQYHKIGLVSSSKCRWTLSSRALAVFSIQEHILWSFSKWLPESNFWHCWLPQIPRFCIWSLSVNAKTHFLSNFNSSRTIMSRSEACHTFSLSLMSQSSPNVELLVWAPNKLTKKHFVSK